MFFAVSEDGALISAMDFDNYKRKSRSQSSLISLYCSPSIAHLEDTVSAIMRYSAIAHFIDIMRFLPYLVDVTKCLSDTKLKPQPIKQR